MIACMLTTIDNPFDCFTQFDSWLNFDLMNHNCSAYLARVAHTSDALSQKENDEEIESAIDEIVKYDPTGLYVKVKREIPDEPMFVEGDDENLDDYIHLQLKDKT